MHAHTHADADAYVGRERAEAIYWHRYIIIDAAVLVAVAVVRRAARRFCVTLGAGRREAYDGLRVCDRARAALAYGPLITQRTGGAGFVIVLFCALRRFVGRQETNFCVRVCVSGWWPVGGRFGKSISCKLRARRCARALHKRVRWTISMFLVVVRCAV